MSDTYRNRKNYDDEMYEDDPRNFLKQQQKKNKKKSKDKKAMGYFTKFNTGNCMINNAVFNNSTKAGMEASANQGCGNIGNIGGGTSSCPGSGMGTGADIGTGMGTGASMGGAVSGGCGESFKNKGKGKMKTLKENEGCEILYNPSQELGIDYCAFQDFESDDGKTITTRYTLCNPLTDYDIQRLSDYSNVTYKKNGATYKYAPEITYDLLYVTVQNPDWADDDYTQLFPMKEKFDGKVCEDEDDIDEWVKSYCEKDEENQELEQDDDDKEILTEVEDDYDEEAVDREMLTKLNVFEGLGDDDPIFAEEYDQIRENLFEDIEDPKYIDIYNPTEDIYSDAYITQKGRNADYLNDLTVVSEKVLEGHKKKYNLKLYQSNNTDKYYTVVTGPNTTITDEAQLMEEACGEFNKMSEAMNFFKNYE